VADVRGVFNGGTTPFVNQQVEMSTGWVAPGAPGGIVVTGVGAAGFYVTDISAPPKGYPVGFNSVYAYTYTAPPIMLPCDRLITFGGTAGEFYGFTELNYPTWSLEEWDPVIRPCLIPDPLLLTAVQLPPNGHGATGDLTTLLKYEAALVQVAAGVRTSGGVTTTTTLHVGKHFGPTLVPITPMGQKGCATAGGCYIPDDTSSDCDYNGDGKIEYVVGTPEDLCSTACTADVECSEYSNYLSQAQFRVVVVEESGGATTATGAIQVSASADASFVPTQNAGKGLGGFTGNLIYFSGGSQFTIVARCSDDIVTDPKKSPLPPSKACVVQRNAADQTNAN
jgi:hypothetical protein